MIGMRVRAAPWWAALTIWGVLNVLNLLQTAGFLSRMHSGSMAVNHVLGYGVILLAIPSTWGLVASVRAGAGWLQ